MLTITEKPSDKKPLVTVGPAPVHPLATLKTRSDWSTPEPQALPQPIVEPSLNYHFLIRASLSFAGGSSVSFIIFLGLWLLTPLGLPTAGILSISPGFGTGFGLYKKIKNNELHLPPTSTPSNSG